MVISRILFLCWMATCAIPVFCQQFTAQQQAWLFKIVEKTPTLKRNWHDFFQYQEELPYIRNSITNKQTKEEFQVDWEAVEQNIINNPELLIVNWDAIGISSKGLLAEAAVKLTLWELYSDLKEGYTEDPPFSVNPISGEFYQSIIQSLPSDFRSKGLIKEKYKSLVDDLINPSLPFGKKVNALKDVKKITVQNQKVLVEKWHRMVRRYVERQSQQYFSQLGGGEVYFKGQLLAAGEGSGSAGLLYEYEGSSGKPTDTGNGKGVGLFTYEVEIKGGELVPNNETSSKVRALKSEPTLLHLSLWGLDSSLKPLIVIEYKKRSYLLFADFYSRELSPDRNLTAGISYLDRIEEFSKNEIDNTVSELNKEHGLLEIYNKELELKKELELQVKVLEQEIDSLRKLGTTAEDAISVRLKKIDVKQRNLSDKEVKVKQLERKINDEYKKVDLAEKKKEKMIAVLGDNPQHWTKKDSLYYFDDGTYFNPNTQDLILPTDSTGDVISIKLLAASYSLNSKRKDEVQLYVNETGGVEGKVLDIEDSILAKPLVREEKVKNIFKHSFYFKPDEFDCGCKLDDSYNSLFKELKARIIDKKKVVRFQLYANGVDSINFPCSKRKNPCKYSYGGENADDPVFKNSRRVDVNITESANEVIVLINGFTDAVPSKLSKVKAMDKKPLFMYQNKTQKYNPALSALRVVYALQEVRRISGLNAGDAEINFPDLDKKIRISVTDAIMSK